MDNDPYAVLGVSDQATTAEIHRAYLELARRTHPDVRGPDPAAEAQMRSINLAWEMLSDETSRAAVDRRLRTARQRPSPTGGGAQSHRTTGPPGGNRPQGFADPDLDTSGFGGAEASRDYFGHDDFDGDDRPLTAGNLPAFMRAGTPLAFVLGIFSLVFGVLSGGLFLLRFGVMLIALSLLLFALSPFVVLLRSRSSGRR